MELELTGLQVAFTGFGLQPGLRVLRVIEFGDEAELAGHLAIVGDLETLKLELPELHIPKGELQQTGRSKGHSEHG